MFFPPSVRRLLAACLGLLLCLTPEAAFALPTKDRVAAIPAPSPYSPSLQPLSSPLLPLSPPNPLLPFF